MNEQLAAKIAKEVEDAIAAAGGDALKVKAADIVRAHLGDGVSRASLYRYVGSILDKARGTPRLKPIPRIEITTKTPVFREEITTTPPPGFGRIIGPAGIGLVEALEQCVRAATDVMQHSRHADGKVRLGKSLIAASEHMRRVLETAAKIHESMVTIQRLGAFHEALEAELGIEAPEVRARVVKRLQEVTAKWRTDAGAPPE
jgi:hypothetical protein